MKASATLEFDEKLPVWGATLLSVLTILMGIYNTIVLYFVTWLIEISFPGIFRANKDESYFIWLCKLDK